MMIEWQRQEKTGQVISDCCNHMIVFFDVNVHKKAETRYALVIIGSFTIDGMRAIIT